MTYIVGFLCPDQDLDSVQAQGAALGDGNHIPALVGNLGEEVVFPFPDQIYQTEV